MRILRRYIPLLPFALAFLASGAPPDEIRAAEKAWSDAVVNSDIKALEVIYANKLIYAHSTGVIQTKADNIGQLRSGTRKYKEFSQEPMRIETYPEAAVAHYLAHSVGSVEGKPFDDHVMVLHLWVRQNGKWRLAAHQTTKVP